MTQFDTRAAADWTTMRIVDRLVGFAGPPDAFLRELLAAQCMIAGASAAAVLRVDAQQQAQVIASLPPVDRDKTPPIWLAQAAEVLSGGETFSDTRALPLAKPDALYGQQEREMLVVLPVRGSAGIRGAEAFVVRPVDQADLGQITQRLELSVSLLSLYEMRQTLARRESDLRSLATAVDVLATSNEHKRFRTTALAFCNEVATRWDAERVSVGLLSGRYVKLRALSHTEHVSRKMQVVRDIEAAMEECLDQDVEVYHPASEKATFVSRAAAELAKRHGPSHLISFPLRREGKPVGVVTVERPTDKPFSLEEIEMLRLACDLYTPRLVELSKTDRWFGARMAASTREQASKLLGAEHTWAKLGAIGVLIGICLLVFLRGEYRIESPFIAEATVKRSVPSPFDGYIESVEVEPGDRVIAGETLLAQLKTVELQAQLRKLQDTHFRHLQEAKAAKKQGEIAEAQIAEAEAREVGWEIKLLEEQIRQARLVAPITGVVVEGDLKKNLDASVTRGDVLFEVAPLDSLRAVMYVADERIDQIYEGQAGELAAAAHPSDRVGFTVERINPVAETIDGRNAFRVRLKLDEQRPWFRPGIEGLAKADAGRYTYLWIWTHDAVNWLRLKLWL